MQIDCIFVENTQRCTCVVCSREATTGIQKIVVHKAMCKLDFSFFRTKLNEFTFTYCILHYFTYMTGASKSCWESGMVVWICDSHLKCSGLEPQYL